MIDVKSVYVQVTTFDDGGEVLDSEEMKGRPASVAAALHSIATRLDPPAPTRPPHRGGVTGGVLMARQNGKAQALDALAARATVVRGNLDDAMVPTATGIAADGGYPGNAEECAGVVIGWAQDFARANGWSWDTFADALSTALAQTRVFSQPDAERT